MRTSRSNFEVVLT